MKGCVVFNAYGTDHGSGPRSYSGLADVLAVYFPPHDQVFLIPVDGHPVSKGGLRLEPARNNQRKGIRFAVDFEIGRWTEERLAMLAPATRSPAA